MSRLVIGRLRRHNAVAHISLGVGAVVLAALGHVYLHLAVIQAGYAIAHESHLHHDLEDKNQKLRLELSMRRDPSVIERRAREELKMTPPEPAFIRVLHAAAATAAAVSPPSPAASPPAAANSSPVGAEPR